MTATRKPTREELTKGMIGKRVYKAVRVADRDRLVSLWVKGTKGKPVVSTDANGKEFSGHTLTYEEGRVTSDGRYGIFCCKTLEEALHQSRVNGCGLCRIYTAMSVGTLIENTSSFGSEDTVLYPGIILDKRMADIEWYR